MFRLRTTTLFSEVQFLRVCSTYLSTLGTHQVPNLYDPTFKNYETKENKICVGKYNINYMKAGNGAHNVLCIPGALGTMRTHFWPQLDGFDKENFTLIFFDPPGYGKSRPPEREFPINFYECDADVAYKLMQELKIPTYSVLGYSDGGMSSIILAAKYPNAVQKLVIWGANSFILPHELELYRKIKDVNNWSARLRQPMIDLFGKERFSAIWTEWIETIETIFKTRDGNICTEFLKDVKCPTFILHGEKDPLVDNIHASYLHMHIKGSRLHLYPNGKHNIHGRYPEDFNRRVRDFLLMPNYG